MKLVFMGTPDFAVPSLKALVEAGFEVAAVFTQPDKPKNRGMKLLPTPVKEYALTKDIPVYQPAKMRDGEALGILKEIQKQTTKHCSKKKSTRELTKVNLISSLIGTYTTSSLSQLVLMLTGVKETQTIGASRDLLKLPSREVTQLLS